MTRKLETVGDIAVKKVAKDTIEVAWGIEIQDLYEKLYYVDWYAHAKGRPCFMEFKARDCKRSDYKTLILSAHKYMRLCEYVQRLQANSLMVVWWNDELAYYPVDPCADVDILWGGRKDRKDVGSDCEPVVHLPVDEFKTIKLGAYTP